MTQIKKYLLYIWEQQKKYKKRWFGFFLLLFGFFLVRFPVEEAISRLVNQFNQESPVSFQLNYENLRLSFFNPALVFNEAQILISHTQKKLKLKQLRVYPSYPALLMLKPGIRILFKWPDSTMWLTFRKKTLKKDQVGWFISMEASHFSLAHLQAFSPLLSKISGYFDINIELVLDPSFKQQPDGSWQIHGVNIESQALSYTFPGTTGTISLPSFGWGKVHSEGKVKEGEFLISDISIGEKEDPFQIMARGVLSLFFVKQTFNKSSVAQRKSYDISLDILTSEELKPKLYFLDLFFSSVESETAFGSRHLGRIRGNRANPFDLSSIAKLPSLEEIQNPEDSEEL